MKSLLILLFFIACSLQALCQGDVFIGATKDKVTNFYIMSIRRDHNGSMDVFERVKPSDGMLQAFRKQVIEQRTKEKLDVDGFEKLGYYRRRIQYNCKGKTYRVRECNYYDINGKEISTSDPDPSEKAKWEFVPPSTMREVEFNKACL